MYIATYHSDDALAIGLFEDIDQSENFLVEKTNEFNDKEYTAYDEVVNAEMERGADFAVDIFYAELGKEADNIRG